MCMRILVNGLVDAVLFTALTHQVARELTDCANTIVVLTEIRWCPFVENLDRGCIFQRSL